MSPTTTVDFSNRQLRLESEESAQDTFKDIDGADIEQLILRKNTFGIGGAKVLGEFIQKTPKLKTALLSSIFISQGIDVIPLALPHICNALLQCSQLTTLDLSHNAFGQRSVELLVPLLSQSLSLETVKLADLGMDGTGGQILAGALVTLAKNIKDAGKTSPLRVLVTSQNLMRDASAIVWAEVIRAHTNLEIIQMNRNDFYEDGTIAVASALVECTRLRMFHYCDNVITNSDERDSPRGWEKLVEAIGKARDIESLYITGCLLGEEGADALFALFAEEEFPRLHSLKVAANDFTETHYEALCDAIESGKLPALKIVYADDEVEDQPVFSKLGDLLEARGGKIVLDSDDNEQDEDELVVETSTAPAASVTPAATDSSVSELADLLAGKLEIKSA
ncbi:unnamed protein product [Mycena citricolor]|uniref:RNI-like protein n=1 Tax=Mycena citricolor TaxID=2018698 RepID=A0AAD2K1N8_9AGAR|nr:unnamed protein product [Mycena citricolor]